MALTCTGHDCDGATALRDYDADAGIETYQCEFGHRFEEAV